MSWPLERTLMLPPPWRLPVMAISLASAAAPGRFCGSAWRNVDVVPSAATTLPLMVIGVALVPTVPPASVNAPRLEPVTSVALLLTVVRPVPRAVPEARIAPALMVVPPEWVLAPLSVRVPAPFFTRLTVPAPLRIWPAKVVSEASPAVIVMGPAVPLVMVAPASPESAPALRLLPFKLSDAVPVIVSGLPAPPSDDALPSVTAALLMVVPPVYVLAPVRERVPPLIARPTF